MSLDELKRFEEQLEQQKKFYEQKLEEQEKAFEKKLEEQEKAFEKKEHIWGRSNPLNFPAVHYTRDVAKVNQPFLIFNINMLRPSCALASKRRMKLSVLCYAINKALVGRILDAECLYRKANGEMQVIPWHLSLLEGMKKLTKPSKEAVNEVRQMETKLQFNKSVFGNRGAEEEDKTDDDEESNTDDDDEESNTDDDDDFIPQDMFLKVCDPEEEQEQENDELGADEELRSRAYDIAVEVLDMHAFKTGTGDGMAVVLVVECKVSLTEDAIYQALKYAFARGLQNYLEGGRVAPVHVMVWSGEKWTYGVVDIYGVVELHNGAITPDSYEGLIDGQKTRWKYMKKKDKDFSECNRFKIDKLNALLKIRRKMLQKSCSFNPNIDYSDGYYIVGDVYVNTHDIDLPRGDEANKTLSFGALLFFETLLQIIVGDSVLKWTTADIDNIIRVRKDLKQRKRKAVVDFEESSLKKMRIKI